MGRVTPLSSPQRPPLVWCRTAGTRLPAQHPVGRESPTGSKPAQPGGRWQWELFFSLLTDSSLKKKNYFCSLKVEKLHIVLFLTLMAQSCSSPTKKRPKVPKVSGFITPVQRHHGCSSVALKGLRTLQNVEHKLPKQPQNRIGTESKPLFNFSPPTLKRALVGFLFFAS